jgi:NAD(P)-dependent dehydrogenase (short-subunit alcohol dehydrogenase family)
MGPNGGILCALLLVLCAPTGAYALDASSRKAVLVTGASTGIGRRITEHLAADGYFVYAGARKDSDLQALGAIKNVQPVRLDVASEQDIDAAVAHITREGRGLYGLVNNAGVGAFGPLLEMKDTDFDLVMSVNVYGPYRVTKAFAPLIAAQRGRVVTIGSIAGILAGKQVGAYAMSKHAVEAFVDTLAEEMAPANVLVSLIEPGNYNSDIAKNAFRRQGLDPALGDRSRFKEPDEVAGAVENALSASQPRRRYMVVPNEQEAEVTIHKQIEQLVQLNEAQPYTYDRKRLIEMLDAALSRARQGN